MVYYLILLLYAPLGLSQTSHMDGGVQTHENNYIIQEGSMEPEMEPRKRHLEDKCRKVGLAKYLTLCLTCADSLNNVGQSELMLECPTCQTIQHKSDCPT